MTAEASQLGYKNPQEIENTVVNHWGLSKFHYLEREDSQCFIAGNDDLLLIAFRGSSPSAQGSVKVIEWRGVPAEVTTINAPFAVIVGKALTVAANATGAKFTSSPV